MWLISLVCYIVFMILWLFGGCYLVYEPARPRLLGNVLLPWFCVLILGLVLFGAIKPDTVVSR